MSRYVKLAVYVYASFYIRRTQPLF